MALLALSCLIVEIHNNVIPKMRRRIEQYEVRRTMRRLGANSIRF